MHARSVGASAGALLANCSLWVAVKRQEDRYPAAQGAPAPVARSAARGNRNVFIQLAIPSDWQVDAAAVLQPNCGNCMHSKLK